MPGFCVSRWMCVETVAALGVVSVHEGRTDIGELLVESSARAGGAPDHRDRDVAAVRRFVYGFAGGTLPRAGKSELVRNSGAHERDPNCIPVRRSCRTSSRANRIRFTNGLYVLAPRLVATESASPPHVGSARIV